MALIGDFEVAVRQENPGAEPDQFRLNGQLFTVSGKDLTIAFGRFAKAAMSGLDSAELAGAAAMIDLLTGIVIEEDQERLLSAVDGMDPEKVFEIVAAVVQAQTGRPTQQPSDSSAGQSTTGATSKALSSFEAPSRPPVAPILLDPRVQELRPLSEVGQSLLVG